MKPALLLLVVLSAGCASIREKGECSPEHLQTLRSKVAAANAALRTANPQPDGDSTKNITTDEAAVAAANHAIAQAELAMAIDKCVPKK